MKYIAYYRVSTKTQGDSGLGLEAQIAAVRQFTNDEGIPEYTEIESGKKNDRPILKEALKECKATGATLVIAKMDRLSRNAFFTLQLMDSGVKFVAIDNPNANDLTIKLLAVIAEDEAKRISDRTKKALAIKAQQLATEGKKLGTPANLTAESRSRSIESRRRKAMDNDNNQKASALINALPNLSLGATAKHLNKNNFKTSTGKDFTATAVSRVIKLYSA